MQVFRINYAIHLAHAAKIVRRKTLEMLSHLLGSQQAAKKILCHPCCLTSYNMTLECPSIKYQTEREE